MCTAITFKTKDHYFGRNLDLEYRYNEQVTITPRNYPFRFTDTIVSSSHYAIVGMATVLAEYPLYYDATNEYGLSMAGLHFPGNATYHANTTDRPGIPPYAFIPYVLCQCKCLSDVDKLLENTVLLDQQFREDIPTTPLHWLISDREGSLVVESTESGLQIYQNPVGVLTNNPPFPYHLYNLTNYLNLTREEATNRFSDVLELSAFSNGMGAFGLPGDLSSQSRFVRAAFTKWNSVCDPSEESSITQFFHILDAVKQTRGCARVGDKFEITLYQSCCNTDKCIYYYKSYNNNQITAIHMHKQELNSSELICFPLREAQNIHFE